MRSHLRKTEAPHPSGPLHPGAFRVMRPARRCRNRLALGAVAALYLLPSVLGTLLQFAHGVEHALTWSTELTRGAPRHTVVHSHDGVTHSHGPAVTFLASAVAGKDTVGEGDPETVPPAVLLAILASEPESTPPPNRVEAGGHEYLVAHSADLGSPPLPPPQG